MSFLGKKFYDFNLKKFDDVKNDSALNTSRYNLLIFVDRLDFGDTARNLVDIANGLVKRNVNVTILASSVRYRRQLDADVNVITMNIVKNKLMPFFVKVKRVEYICKIYKIDIVLTNSVECAFIVNKVAKKTNIKWTTYINEIWDVKDEFCKKQHEIMLKSDLMILQSLYMCNYILDNYDHVERKKMKLVDGGVDMNTLCYDDISKGRKVDAIRHLGDVVAGKRILLCPNRFDDKKGQVSLLEAVARVKKKEIKNFICVLIGDFVSSDAYRRNLVKKIKQLDVDSHVLLLDKFDDTPALYTLSYAVLSLSKVSEAPTRIFAEAGAMHCPAIITGVDGLKDYIVNEKNGYIVNPDNIADIGNAIEKLLLMTEERYKGMCDFAYQYVLKYFNVNRTIIEVDDVLSLLV